MGTGFIVLAFLSLNSQINDTISAGSSNSLATTNVRIASPSLPCYDPESGIFPSGNNLCAVGINFYDDLSIYHDLYANNDIRADVDGDGWVTINDQELFMDSLNAHDGSVVAIISMLNGDLIRTYSQKFSNLVAYQKAFGVSNTPAGPANPTQDEINIYLVANPCYRFANLGGTQFGKVVVFPRGPMNINNSTYQSVQSVVNLTTNPHPGAAYQYDNKPQPRCVDNLGIFNGQTGVRTATNDGYLRGLYSDIELYGTTSRFRDLNNDFRIFWPSLNEDLTRDQHTKSAQAHQYYFWNDFRNRVLSPSVILQAGLSSTIDKNIRYRQFRSGLIPNPSNPSCSDPNQECTRADTMRIAINDTSSIGAQALFFFSNIWAWLNPYNPYNYVRPASLSYSPESAISDGAGLITTWLSKVNNVFPGESGWIGNGMYRTNILPALNDGISSYFELRNLQSAMSDDTIKETNKYMFWMNRHAEPNPATKCGSSGANTLPYCNTGGHIRNVMTMSEISQTSTASVGTIFPFNNSIWASSYANYAGSDLSGIFFADLMFDIAFVGGIGLQRTDVLLLKALSYINRVDKFPVRYWGQLLMRAARELWPAVPGDYSVSVYEDDIHHALLLKGIAVDQPLFCSDLDDIDGAADPYTCCNTTSDPGCANAKTLVGTTAADVRPLLPLTVGWGQNSRFRTNTSLAADNRYLGSNLPEGHPGITAYNTFSVATNQYTHDPVPPNGYVAYTFMRGSEYGPSDKLFLTNDPSLWTALNSTSTFTCPTNQGAGLKCVMLEGDRMDNLTVLMPSNTLLWRRQPGRATNEREATYIQDTSPIGWRVTQATINGFSFKVTDLGTNANSRSLKLEVVDPSYNASTDTYQWIITRYITGSNQKPSKIVDPAQSGLSLNITTERNQPMIVELRRNRSSVIETLKISTTVEGITRNAGQQYVMNLTQ